MKKLIYSFLFLLCSVFALQAESMVVATYNLRNANAGDSTNGNGWGQRYPYIAQLIQFHGFDIFGTQEGKYQQLQDLKNAMPGYDYIVPDEQPAPDGRVLSRLYESHLRLHRVFV